MANGLLSDVNFNDIATNPLLNIGAGLLSVAGPSRQPQSLGTGLLRGLQAARQAEELKLRNQAVRDELQARARAREARNQLFQPKTSVDVAGLPTIGDIAGGMDTDAMMDAAVTTVPMQGLLEPGGLQDPQNIGLLAEAFPEQFGQGLLNSVFPSDRRQNSLIEQAQFAFPNDPQAQREFVAQNAGQGDVATQLDLLQARQRQIEIQNALDERLKEARTEREKRGSLIASVSSDLKDARRLAEINSQLENTVGQAGVPMPELRRAVTSGASFVGDLLGVDTKEASRIVNLMDEFNKISSRFATQSAVDLFDTGNITNFQLQSIQSATPSINIAPGANNRIIADYIETALSGADRANIDIRNRDEYERLISRLRGEDQGRSSQGRTSSGSVVRFGDGTTVEFQ